MERLGAGSEAATQNRRPAAFSLTPLRGRFTLQLYISCLATQVTLPWCVPGKAATVPSPWLRCWLNRHFSLPRRPAQARLPRRPLLVEALEARELLSVFTVLNTSDSGTNSLRWAINQSNTTLGPDTIQFNLGGATPAVITPASALPAITSAVTIDGTSQPGYSGSPLIWLKGASSGSAAYDGLTITAAGCTVEGLVISRFANGITITGGGATG